MTSASTTTATTCWSCGQPAAGGHFCVACGKIQPLTSDVDYFAFFGLPQKLALDPADLEQRFHALSWKLHPDNFVRASEAERELSLERSSQLNDAYRTLQDAFSRTEYLLALKGIRGDGQNKQQPPPELLEEVFELNESLDELRMARKAGEDAVERASLHKKLILAANNFTSKSDNINAELLKLSLEWDGAIDAGADATTQRLILERLNAALNRRSYIGNLILSVQRGLHENC